MLCVDRRDRGDQNSDEYVASTALPRDSLPCYQSINNFNSDSKDEDSVNQGGFHLCGGEEEGQYSIRRWCGVRRSTCLLLLYIITYLGYLVGGGFLFSYLESRYEMDTKREINDFKERFIKKHHGVSSEDVEEFVREVTSRRISPLQENLNKSDWSFGQSFLFTVTVVTTIGYGHVTPVTPVGKLICIIYAMIGIPFTLVFLSAVVQRLLSPTFRFLGTLLAKLGSRIDPFEIRVIHLSILSTVFVIFVFFIPSAMFWKMEPSWTYLDAIYFVFISLTTIGLGDYIPGDHYVHADYRDLYKTCVGLYLLVGLMFVTLSLSVYYDIPQLNLGLHLHHHRDIFTKSVDNLEEAVTETSTTENEATAINGMKK